MIFILCTKFVRLLTGHYWFNTGKKLKEKSFGAVNVKGPKKRWGQSGVVWKGGKLAAYLCKYLGKEFEEGDKGAKKYWSSKPKEKHTIERFWLKAKDHVEAIREALALIKNTGARGISIWNDESSGVVWITGEVPKELLSWEHCEQCKPDFDLLND